MSIAVTSSSFAPTVRAGAPSVPVDPVQALRETHRSPREGGHRHELVSAMNQVLGRVGEQDERDAQAVFRFAHALMRDLRSIEAGSGRGNGWGQRDWGDLPQRIDALATAVGVRTGEPPAAKATEVTLSTAVDATPVAEPAMPKPITMTSAAVYMMQIPSSRLIQAYEALRQAMGNQPAAPTAASMCEDLAAFLERLSSRLAPDAAGAVPAGSVVHLIA